MSREIFEIIIVTCIILIPVVFYISYIIDNYRYYKVFKNLSIGEEYDCIIRDIEDLFQTSYDEKIKDRIESIIDQYANYSQNRERLLQICKVAVQNQHAIDLQRAWKLFQKYATYIHPRTGKVIYKMNLFQFTKQMEQE